MKKRIMGLFGRVKIPMEWCDKCRNYAFVIDNKIQCCDRRVVNTEEKPPYVRFSEGSSKRGRLPKKERERILKQQDYLCIYCGLDLHKVQVHFDHFIPFSFDYSSPDPEGMVASCADCNLLKSNKMYNSTEEVWDDIKEKRQTRSKDMRKLPRGFLPEAEVAEVLFKPMPILCVGRKKSKKKRKRKHCPRAVGLGDLKQKICLFCNNTFETRKANKKFCRPSCSSKNRYKLKVLSAGRKTGIK